MKQEFAERVGRAAGSVAHLPRVDVGVVLGSGLGEMIDRVEGQEVSYARIDGFPLPTVAGHQGRLRVAQVGRVRVAFLAGRFHLYEGRSLDDVILPVFLLARLGAERVVVTNAAGAVNEHFQPGDLVLIRDHLNLMGVNPLIGPVPQRYGSRFLDMTHAYSARLRSLAGASRRTPLAEGVYAAVSGPSFETPAEIRMLRSLGADMVGMSTVPEVIAARFLGMEVLGISCISNMAAGILDQPLSHEEVVETGRMVAAEFARLVLGFLASL